MLTIQQDSLGKLAVLKSRTQMIHELENVIYCEKNEGGGQLVPGKAVGTKSKMIHRGRMPGTQEA